MIRDFRNLTADDFELYYPLLEQNFPPGERREKVRQRALLADPRYYAEGLFAPAGELLLLCCSWRLSTRFFIEHLVVSETARGRGLGARYIHERQARAQIESLSLLLEVEPPSTTAARRRIHFYERCGFFLNPQAYLQPAMQAGEAPLELGLMSWPLALNDAEFNALVAELYALVYKAI